MIPSADLLNWLRELPSRRARHMLRLIAALLRKHGEGRWEDELTETGATLDRLHDIEHPAETAAAMQRILNFFDRRASLRDLRLSPDTGHKIRPEETDIVNMHLGALTTQLFLSARQTIARLDWRKR